MEKEIEQLKTQIALLEKRLDQLNSNTTMPLQVGEAIKNRVGYKFRVSDKGATSEQHGAGDAGLKNPDAFIQADFNGLICYIPYFT